MQHRGSSRKIGFLFLACLQLLFARTSRSQWSPKDVYRIDCGSSANSTIVDGLEWQADAMASGGSIILSNETVVAPYPTARIFTLSGSYNVPVTPGRHWIRLHFFPITSQAFDPSKSRFSVSVGSHLLISNASIVDELRDRKQGSLVREFSIHAASSTLSISFDPSAQSFAFVNGIEVISMAHDALSSTVTRILGATEQVDAIDIASVVTQTMFRLNVGGDLVASSNDSVHQGRTWEPDSPYLTGVVKGDKATPAVKDVSYPSGVPEYIAPRAVYGTARTLGNANTATNSLNLSWAFLVDSGFMYYVRLHFAEIVYTSPLQRIFSVYLNNQTGTRELDVLQLVPVNTPYYKDYVVDATTTTTLRLQIGPTPASGSQYDDAILNGVEIFKLSDSAGNVGGPAAGGVVGGEQRRRNTGKVLGAAIGAGVGAVALVILVAVAICLLCRGGDKKTKKQQPSSWQPLSAAAGGNSHSVITASSIGGSPKSAAGSYFSAPGGGGGVGRYFTFQELFDATNGFDESRLLGVGGFGKVFKGELDGGTLEVAIKRGSPRSEQGQAEFQAEIELLSKLRHRHLVSLIGYCDEQQEMILVYEYMARGPLRGHLYGTNSNSTLSWKQRLEAVVAAARGLHYLHTGADHSRAVIHRDVKTTNILLDEHLMAKVSDFGLSKTGPMLNETHVSTAVKGSFGYLDPEYFRRQQLTDKSDVYSFGVVLVEVMCSRPAIDPSLPREQVNIAEWAMDAKRRGELLSVVDPRLVAAAEPASLARVADVAEKCLAEQGVDRPTMGHVLWSLEAALHIQETAEQQQQQEQEQQHQQQRRGSGFRAVEMASAPQSATAPQLQQQQQEQQDFEDGYSYSQHASASAVFSQLIQPQGR